VDSTATKTLWAAAATALAALTIFAVLASTAEGAGYARPKGASPYRTPLVPLYERCETNGGRTADTFHGAPLAHPACKDPELISGMLTIGSPDANGKTASSIGSFVLATKAGNPSTPADEADVKVNMSITDVRLQQGLGDYIGELQLSLESRITDRANGQNQDQPATTEDFFWTATVPCSATISTSIGATCALQTTVDSLVPGTIKEGNRTVWEQHDHIHVFDGGEDKLAATEDDNLLFAVQGYYVP
jgi:hypothetical protein